MQFIALICVALGFGRVCAADWSRGNILNVTPGVVRFSKAHEGEGVYVSVAGLTNENGVPTVHLPLAQTLRVDINFINGYSGDILLKVDPEREIVSEDADTRYWLGVRERPHIKRPSGFGQILFYHHQKYESLKGLGVEQVPAGAEWVPCCCTAKRITWQKQLATAEDLSTRFHEITRAECTLPILLNYIVVGRTNVYEVETALRFIMERKQPTSGSSEPPQSSGR